MRGSSGLPLPEGKTGGIKQGKCKNCRNLTGTGRGIPVFIQLEKNLQAMLGIEAPFSLAIDLYLRMNH